VVRGGRGEGRGIAEFAAVAAAIQTT